MTKPTRILVIDDEPAIREMISFTLIGAGFECDEAGDADEATQRITACTPDLILLDWMLPGRSGLEYAQSLRRDITTNGIPIIMLSARTEESHKVLGLNSGADDYITKPFSPRELIARILAVMRRSTSASTTNVLKVDKLTLDPDSHRVNIGDDSLSLGPTEFRLLHFFMGHPERVYGRAQLIDLIWGKDVYVEERTVDVHIRRLRKVLEPHHYDQFIQTVRSAGYRFSTKKK
ncbi:MAG: phosphate regulon transcriptional regulatory protein PhoB [Gammaproteobacteria bacterium]|nr:phosphate regulon transcriptional regulatory protein PhoB [Gammaproteobacteria bacterium]